MQVQASGYTGGYTRVTDFIRAWRADEGKNTQAFVPLKFQLGEAFQFDWSEEGIVAQIMGHKPSATAEKHYTVRPLDLLRVHHEKIEAWILEQAGVTFARTVEPGKLRVVA